MGESAGKLKEERKWQKGDDGWGWPKTQQKASGTPDSFSMRIESPCQHLSLIAHPTLLMESTSPPHLRVSLSTERGTLVFLLKLPIPLFKAQSFWGVGPAMEAFQGTEECTLKLSQ